eukprot:CAMPEP_0184677952 /NCGR_PEP_ID=MMETSP0312-20130426/573_1 /TAXON_ID=31354 /ORGANISM="Compsopogon coeruleus, Strain SAG 36.94" /LENGTH=656 /DNA_ID=CAMNT_0027126205 /DNA_START=1131 /DNA_END=3101 /DNA_ORIENTATION=+
MVHLFEWAWTDIAIECEQHLGPKGFAAVQVSPPQEHVSGPQWWTRYQPVSYRIQSRSGNQDQFLDMVRRCNRVGVDIYVDAVLNHMTGVGSGDGVGGSSYSEYRYPSVPYGALDFHYCGNPGHDIQPSDYSNSAYNVRNCELVNLADLKTESSYVRSKLSGYLRALMDLGVAGFRIDAAKHMYAADIAAIISQTGGSPYIYQEVIGGAGQPITPEEYFPNGDALDFTYGLKLAQIFRQSQLKYLKTFGATWGLLPSEKAVVFTNNHDNQRGHGGAGDVLTFRDGQLHTLATIFMLAWPYGYPQVMSSYHFSDADQGPPSSPASGCNYPWVCEHRVASIERMVAFRNVASAAFFVSNWWDNGANAIAFGRGDRAFVVINRESDSVSATLKTMLDPGFYCDVINGDVSQAGGCTGPTVEVKWDGTMTVQVGGTNALAFHQASKLGSRPTTSPPMTSASPLPPTTSSPTMAASPLPTNEPASFPSMYLRGEFNNWTATPMLKVDDQNWALNISNLTGGFKFDVYGDWSEKYGAGGGPGSTFKNGGDISGPGGPAAVYFRESDRTYHVETLKSSFGSLFIRGEFNRWRTTPMVLVEMNVWKVIVGNLSGGFKFDVKGDWTENYGGGRMPGSVARNGPNIVGPGGRVTVIFFDLSLNYRIE